MLRMIWRLVAYLLVLYSLLWIVLCYQNGYLLIFIRASHLHCIWDMVVVRGCTISRVVSRDAMDIIFRGRYRAPRRLLLSRVVSCAATDAWTDMSPMGPGLRDNGCVSLRKTCITIFDIASHGIAHFIIDELEHAFCWSWDCFSLKLVTVEYWVVIENV